MTQHISLNFIDTIQASMSIETCQDNFARFASQQGYRHFYFDPIGDQVRSTNDNVVESATNFPAFWMEEYVTDALWQNDPYFEHVNEKISPLLLKKNPSFSVKQQQVYYRFEGNVRDLNGFAVGLPSRLAGLKSAVTLTTPDKDQHFETHHQRNFSHVYLALMAMQKRCEDLIFQDIYTGSSEVTDRELEVMKWIALGKTSGEIADILYITERTVNHHAGSVMHKMNCVTRTQAVAELIFQKRIQI